MNNLMQSILIGISNFPFFAVILTLPIFATQLMKYKAINPVRIAVNYVAILYFLCLFALVFLPLPDMAKASQLSGYKIQLIPFRFLADIIKESPLVITNIHTYIPAIFHRAVLQVVFNVIMTIPFGMLLSYYFEFDAKKVPESVKFHFYKNQPINVAIFYRLHTDYNQSYRSKGHTTPP